MVYLAKTNVKEIEFVSLLEKSRRLMLHNLSGKKNVSPIGFEEAVLEQMSEAAKGTDFEGRVQQTGVHAFPDIVMNEYFGVEAKMTQRDHWTSTGNSVLESSRLKDVQRIYIMFGKFGGKLDIRYRLYQECLPEISVTHAPRYRINMNLPSGKSIFDKMGIGYDALRKDQNTIERIKNYYRSQLKEGEALWWLEQDDEKATSPIIKSFRSLDKKEQEHFLVESMIFFPEMFGKSSVKFGRAAAYLMTDYNAVSANLRDLFTAGGRVKLTIRGRDYFIPRIAHHLHMHAQSISKKLDTTDEEPLRFYWGNYIWNGDKLEQFKKLIDMHFASVMLDIKASDIFENGLE